MIVFTLVLHLNKWEQNAVVSWSHRGSLWELKIDFRSGSGVPLLCILTFCSLPELSNHLPLQICIVRTSYGSYNDYVPLHFKVSSDLFYLYSLDLCQKYHSSCCFLFVIFFFCIENNCYGVFDYHYLIPYIHSECPWKDQLVSGDIASDGIIPHFQYRKNYFCNAESL